MAVANAMSVTVIIAVALSAAIGVSSAEFSIGSSERAAYKKCTKDKTRCAGAPGYPYVHYAPCCEKGSMCIEDEALGWGKWCVKPKKERKGKCYLNKNRCMGAPGKPYIPYYKCCGGGECVADKKLGWGKFCKSGKYGDDYKVSEYGKGYKVVYYDDDKKDKKEKKKEVEHEKKSYKNYVDEYEKEYYAKDYEKEYKDYEKEYKDYEKKYKSKDDHKKAYGSDYGYGYGYGYGKGKKAKDVVVPGKGHGKDFIKKILGPNGGNPFCRVNGEPLGSSGITVVTIPTGQASSNAFLIIRSSTACHATAETFPLRIVTAIVSNVCAQFRALVPTGDCGFTAITNGVTMRMANVEEFTNDVSVRQPGASAVILRFTFSYPCAFAATAARFFSQNFDQVVPNNAVCTTTTPASTTTADSSATSTVASVIPGGAPLVCTSSSSSSSSDTAKVLDDKPTPGKVARFVKVTIPAESLCEGTTETTLSQENANRITNSICGPIIEDLGSGAGVSCRIIGLSALVSTSRTAVVRQASSGGVVVRQGLTGLDLDILIEVLQAFVAALEQAIAELSQDANVSVGPTPPGVTPSS